MPSEEAFRAPTMAIAGRSIKADVAHGPEKGWRVWQIAQGFGIVGAVICNKARTHRPRGLQFCVNDAVGAGRVVLDTRGTGYLWQRFQRVLRAAMFGQQSTISGNANSA